MRKRGALITLVTLVATLACAFVAYRGLSARRGAVTAAPSAASGSSAASHAADAVLLADHDATVYTDLGEPVRLSAIADGKPLVVNIWATWCPYCVQELADYQALYDEFGDRVAFAFVDATDGERETKADALAWLATSGYDLPAYFDEDLEASITFGAMSLPTTVVVDASGEVLTVTAGVIDPQLMRDALGSLV